MANMTFKADLLPSSNLGYSLGSSDKLWNIPGYLKLSGGTMTGTLLMKGYAADNPIVTRGITGSDGLGTIGGELYLNYNGGPVFFSTGGTAYVENGTFYGTFNGNATQNVKKAGDTMTGPLSYQVSNINATATNNNISSIYYPTTFNILDNGGRIITRLESVVNPNGNIGSYWYVRNYNTSGDIVAQKALQ